MPKLSYVQPIGGGPVFTTACPDDWSGYKTLSARDGRAAVLAQTRERLRRLLPPGATAYVVVMSVSSSGLSRVLSAYAVDGNARLVCLDRDLLTLGTAGVRAAGDRMRISGGGMDMGFHLIDCLKAELYGDAVAHFDLRYI